MKAMAKDMSKNIHLQKDSARINSNLDYDQDVVGLRYVLQKAKDIYNKNIENKSLTPLRATKFFSSFNDKKQYFIANTCI